MGQRARRVNDPAKKGWKRDSDESTGDQPSDFRTNSPILFMAPFSLVSVESTWVERSLSML